VLSRDKEWIWDSWYVVNGDDLHAYYLMAPRSLGNPDLRHINARIGHSVTQNGTDWVHLPEAFGPSEVDDFDNQAIWTGSIIREAGLWHMFYTGITRETKERVQAVGHATSEDLMTWKRVTSSPILRAEPPYGTLDRDGVEHFRDPWVFKSDNRWHMLVTSNEGSGWGTIAHATSDDLMVWTLHAPLVHDSRLKQIEVTETIFIDGQWVLLFCANGPDIQREGITSGFGTYCAPASGPAGPFDLDKIEFFAPGIYAARAVEFQGKWLLFGFLDSGEPGGFQGVIGDPRELRLTDRGTLELV
jgi:beta-fructofuranosidase